MKLTKAQKKAYEDLKKYGPAEISVQINRRTARALIGAGIAEIDLSGDWGGIQSGGQSVRATQCCMCDNYTKIADESNRLCSKCATAWKNCKR